MMFSSSGRPRRPSRFSLSLRLSLLLLLAAVLPLVITVVADESIARSRLIDQGTKALQTDARNRVDLINAYLHERRLDVETITQISTTQVFFEDITAGRPPSDLLHAEVALGAGTIRDKRYSAWSFVDRQGHVQLSTQPKLMQPGAVQIPARELQAVLAGNEYFSPVSLDPETGQGLIQIDVPVAPKGQVLGFIRASLKLTYIWDIVAADQGANGDGSAAFMVDENGIRIADTDAARRFTAVAQLPVDVQSAISAESRFGAVASVNIEPLPQVADALKQPGIPALFQSTASQNDSTIYQFVGQALTEVPWMYFVLSPLPTVTAVADTQVKISALIALIVATLAAVVGLYVGRSTAQPVLSSVGGLRSASTSLNTMSARQESAAAEQLWMVEACQSGVENIAYLSKATTLAVERMIQIGEHLAQHWGQLSPEEISGAVSLLINLARYVGQAAQQQQESSDKLGTAVKVTNQVSDQLAASAQSAGEYAGQLEQIVEQLQRLVGVKEH